MLGLERSELAGRDVFYSSDTMKHALLPSLRRVCAQEHRHVSWCCVIGQWRRGRSRTVGMVGGGTWRGADRKATRLRGREGAGTERTVINGAGGMAVGECGGGAWWDVSKGAVSSMLHQATWAERASGRRGPSTIEADRRNSTRRAPRVQR